MILHHQLIYFQLKDPERGIKVPSPKQMLQRLPIAPAQAKDKSQNVHKKIMKSIKKIICSLYQSKEMTKKVYDN